MFKSLCDPIDCNPPGSSVHEIFQARILKWVAISFSRDLSNPGIEPGSPALQADSLPSEPLGKPDLADCISEGEGEVAQSCPTLCDPVDCSLPGFSVHGILQARILEWVTISFSRGSS